MDKISVFVRREEGYVKEQLEGGCNYTPEIPELWRLRQKGGELGAELHSNTLLKKEEKKSQNTPQSPQTKQKHKWTSKRNKREATYK